MADVSGLRKVVLIDLLLHCGSCKMEGVTHVALLLLLYESRSFWMPASMYVVLVLSGWSSGEVVESLVTVLTALSMVDLGKKGSLLFLRSNGWFNLVQF